MPPGERSALKDLQDDDSIKVIPADKGNALVVIVFEEYSDKCNEHLSNYDIYTKLENNPMETLKGKVNRFLKKCKDDGVITPEDYQKLYVNTSITPLFYAVIKTHKPGNPIRPIVSFIDSPTYQLAKYLATKNINYIYQILSDRKMSNSQHAK